MLFYRYLFMIFVFQIVFDLKCGQRWLNTDWGSVTWESRCEVQLSIICLRWSRKRLPEHSPLEFLIHFGELGGELIIIILE